MKLGPTRALSKTLIGPSAVRMVSPHRQRSFSWTWSGEEATARTGMRRKASVGGTRKGA
jgi:hypothetical protein